MPTLATSSIPRTRTRHGGKPTFERVQGRDEFLAVAKSEPAFGIRRVCFRRAVPLLLHQNLTLALTPVPALSPNPCPPLAESLYPSSSTANNADLIPRSQRFALVGFVR